MKTENRINNMDESLQNACEMFEKILNEWEKQHKQPLMVNSRYVVSPDKPTGKVKVTCYIDPDRNSWCDNEQDKVVDEYMRNITKTMKSAKKLIEVFV